MNFTLHLESPKVVIKYRNTRFCILNSTLVKFHQICQYTKIDNCKMPKDRVSIKISRV